MYVKDHMIKNPYCITSDTSISKSLEIMDQHGFHRLPVVDENYKIIGIITENDIFTAFMDLLGYPVKGTRFSILITEDAYGILSKIGTIFAQNNINLLRLAVYHSERGIEVVVITEEKCPEMKEKLENAGWKIVDIRN